jgi:hypothetical protein
LPGAASRSPTARISNAPTGSGWTPSPRSSSNCAAWPNAALSCLLDTLRAFLQKLFGPRHLAWKLATVTALIVIAFMTLADVDYRVSAKTVVEGEVRRVVAVALFDGFIGQTPVRAGDTVKAGQLLARLRQFAGATIRALLSRCFAPIWTSRTQFSLHYRRPPPSITSLCFHVGCLASTLFP